MHSNFDKVKTSFIRRSEYLVCLEDAKFHASSIQEYFLFWYPKMVALFFMFVDLAC
jgi:hypothetical protein